MGSKNHPLTKSFLGFIDNVNKADAGTVQIKFLGGPEVAKPREQPIAMRDGLFDLVCGRSGN